MKKTTSATSASKSTSKSSGWAPAECTLRAEFPNGDQRILWISANGRQFVVRNPKECANFNHMVKHDRTYRIAGKMWKIHGVCPYSFHVSPYPVGIPILLECLPA